MRFPSWLAREKKSLDHKRSQAAPAVFEELEPRLLLDATYEVWAGDTDFSLLPNYWEHYYSIDQQAGYVKLGEADGDATFVGDYNYFVIAANDHLYVDAIQTSDGGYDTGISPTGNDSNSTNMTGAPDSDYGFFDGDADSGGTFGSFAVVLNWKGWTSIHIVTNAGPTSGPDLVVSVENYQAGTYSPGDWLEASGWEENVGDAAAPPTFYVEVALSTDNQWDAGDIQLLWLTEDEGLDAGERYPDPGSATESIQIPADTPAGNYYFLAKIDTTDAVDESNESNNVWPSPSADIIIADGDPVQSFPRDTA